MSKEKPLAGQVAWVTGSSRGLGRVMATKLCQLGAAVVVHGTRFDSPRSFGEGESMEQVARDVAAEAGGTALPVWGDVTDEAEVKRMADAVRVRLGPIDILVANAGGDIGAGGTTVGRGGRPSSDDCISIPLADIRAVMDRNLLSCILCCRETAPDMMARKRGRVITVGSIAGTFGRDDGAIYAVAKAAVHEYTRCLAVQLRPYNIPVNCIAPGGTVTNRFLVIHDIDRKKLVEEGTLDRYGRPHEVASVVAFLASEEGRFISGQVIRVDGGSQCWPAIREAEAKEAAAILGVENLDFLRLPDLGLADRIEQVAQRLEIILAARRPDLIYLPHTEESHPDHAVVLTAARTALEQTETLPKVPELRGYEVWSAMTRPGWVEDISEVMGRKIRAIHCYRSQLRAFRYDWAIRGLNRYRGTLNAGSRYAEAFCFYDFCSDAQAPPVRR